MHALLTWLPSRAAARLDPKQLEVFQTHSHQKRPCAGKEHLKIGHWSLNFCFSEKNHEVPMKTTDLPVVSHSPAAVPQWTAAEHPAFRPFKKTPCAIVDQSRSHLRPTTTRPWPNRCRSHSLSLSRWSGRCLGSNQDPAVGGVLM